MVFNFKFHWAPRFAFSLALLTAPLFYLWNYPLLARTNSIEAQRREERKKTLAEVRVKSRENVQVLLPKIEAFYEKYEKSGSPSYYHSFPSDEEIQKKNLYVIGHELCKDN